MRKDGKSLHLSYRAVIDSLRSLPAKTLFITLSAFFLGFILRSGCTTSYSDLQRTAEHMHENEEQVEWWTCSMHPQIRLKEAGQCPICFMDLIPLETQDIGEGEHELKMSDAAVKLAEIATTRVRRETAHTEIRLSGKIGYDETRVVKISAWVEGRIEVLHIDYTGNAVKKGDALVELYSPTLYTAQEELLQARKNTIAGSSLVREASMSTLEAAREKLRLLGLTEAQIANIESSGIATDRITVVSPESGVVIHKNAFEGMYLSKGTTVYTVADLSHVWVVLDAYESDLAWLKEGQVVNFSLEAYPGELFHGSVAFVDPILNDKTRSVKVRVNVPNPANLLKPGMFVRATIYPTISSIGKDNKPPLLVPASAVLRTGKRAIAYVKKPDQAAPVYEGREIILGPRATDSYIVLSGLEEGEEVVVKGNFKIDSAMQIVAKPSMMNPDNMLSTKAVEPKTLAKKGHQDENDK